jgi:hypothetical protein
MSLISIARQSADRGLLVSSVEASEGQNATNKDSSSDALTIFRILAVAPAVRPWL